MPRRFSPRFERDFLFYLKNKDRFSFCGRYIQVEHDPRGMSAKQSFYMLDTHSQSVLTREPDLLKEIIICKKSINLHIRSWAEGWDDVCEPIKTYMDEFIDPPEWIERALKEQVLKITVRQIRTVERNHGPLMELRQTCWV